MRNLLLLVPLALLLVGCEQPVGSLGTDLGPLFPANADHYWQYTNFGRAERAYWVNEGVTDLDGEDASTFRIWVGTDIEVRDDYLADQEWWAVTVWFVDRADGWYFMGWDANPNGPSAGLGTNQFEAPGVPIATSSISVGLEVDSVAGGLDWTTTYVEQEAGPFEFNGQSYTDAWHVNLTSSAGNTPFEGDYWLKAGPGIIQYDVVGYRPATGEPWTHFHNDRTAVLFQGQ